MIKEAYFHPKKVGNFDIWVPRVLLVVAFDIEQSMFKLSMKSNAVDAMAKPINVNRIFCIWCTLLTSKVLSSSFPKYFKLAKINMVQVTANVEDECYLNSLVFCKSKSQNRFTTNLEHILTNLRLNC